MTETIGGRICERCLTPVSPYLEPLTIGGPFRPTGPDDPDAVWAHDWSAGRQEREGAPAGRHAARPAPADRYVVGVNADSGSEYDARCSPCFLGRRHAWSAHVNAIHAYVSGDPSHACGGACPSAEIRSLRPS